MIWASNGQVLANRVPLGAIRVTVSELHEIWQVEGKQGSEPDS